MRSAFRKLLRRLGFGVWKIDSPETINFENLLWSVLEKDGGVFYLQIGANDGVFVDPIYEFISRHSSKVRGVAVEPVPHTFEKLKRNLSAFPQVLPVCIALHQSLKTMPMYCMKPEIANKRNPHAIGMASFDRDHLLRDNYLSESDIESYEVECCTVKELIADFALEDINVLIIDTEGYDAKILEMVDLETIRPSIIRFEHGMKSDVMSKETLLEIVSRLNSYGYQIIVEDNDATAVLI
jgi:FkbM family methyltransferase